MGYNFFCIGKYVILKVTGIRVIRGSAKDDAECESARKED